MDYIDPKHSFVARMPMYYAFRDAFGLLDVVEDSKATLRGEGMDYREFEPAEGYMHQGDGRDRRIRAGLRYSKGGQRKYWLPKATEEIRPPGLGERVVNRTIAKITRRGSETEDVHAPLLAQDGVVHLAPDLQPNTSEEPSIWPEAEVENGYELPFGDLDEGDEELYAHSQKYLFGDYNYPCVDVSSESARMFIWDEEERVLRDERGAWFSPIRGAKGQVAIQKRERPAWEGYGAVSNSQNQNGKSSVASKNRFYDDEREGDRVIDHESDRIAQPVQPRDVILKWTKKRKDPSHPQKPSSDGPPASGSGSSLRDNHSSRMRSSPVTSLHNPRTNDPPPPTLPSDAVDLVVEDSHVSEEEQSHERRTAGRVRVNPHLKKVYHRGAGAGAEGEEDERRVGAGEENLHSGRGDGDGTDGDGDDDRVMVIEGTPPRHARMHVYNYDDIPVNDNPWA